MAQGYSDGDFGSPINTPYKEVDPYGHLQLSVSHRGSVGPSTIFAKTCAPRLLIAFLLSFSTAWTPD